VPYNGRRVPLAQTLTAGRQAGWSNGAIGVLIKFPDFPAYSGIEIPIHLLIRSRELPNISSRAFYPRPVPWATI